MQISGVSREVSRQNLGQLFAFVAGFVVCMLIPKAPSSGCAGIFHDHPAVPAFDVGTHESRPRNHTLGIMRRADEQKQHGSNDDGA